MAQDADEDFRMSEILAATDEELARALAEEDEKNTRQNSLLKDEELAMNIYTRELAYVTQLKCDRELAESLQKKATITTRNVSTLPEGRYLNPDNKQPHLQPPSRNRDDTYETDEEVARDLEEEEIKRTQSCCLNDEQFAMNMYTREIEYGVQLDRDRDLAELLQKESIEQQAEEIVMAPSFIPNVDTSNVQTFVQDQREPSPNNSFEEDTLRIPDDLEDYEALLELGEQIGDAKECRLSEIQLNSLPIQVYKGSTSGAKSEPTDENQCSVCREDFVNGQDIRMLPCLHRYHKTCIDAWLQAKSKCPICNLDLKEEIKMN